MQQQHIAAKNKYVFMIFLLLDLMIQCMIFLCYSFCSTFMPFTLRPYTTRVSETGIIKTVRKRTVVVRFAAVAARCPKNVKERASLSTTPAKANKPGYN
jgi:hypothetical protein